MNSDCCKAEKRPPCPLLAVAVFIVGLASSASASASCSWDWWKSIVIENLTYAGVTRCLEAGWKPDEGASDGWTLMRVLVVGGRHVDEAPAMIAALVAAGGDVNHSLYQGAPTILEDAQRKLSEERAAGGAKAAHLAEIVAALKGEYRAGERDASPSGAKGALWGAIAIGPLPHATGERLTQDPASLVWNYPSRGQAEQHATTLCNREYPRSKYDPALNWQCEVFLVFSTSYEPGHRCGAQAEGIVRFTGGDGTMPLSEVGSGRSKREAERVALALCRKNAGSCRVKLSQCNDR